MSAPTPADEPTDLSITERLVLRCWNGDKGTLTDACDAGVHHRLGGALLVDALLTGLIDIDDDRATWTGASTDDAPPQAVVEAIEGVREPPTPVAQRVSDPRR